MRWSAAATPAVDFLAVAGLDRVVIGQVDEDEPGQHRVAERSGVVEDAVPRDPPSARQSEQVEERSGAVRVPRARDRAGGGGAAGRLPATGRVRRGR
ncbi:hypothetical protein ACU686_44185 [Yinghuangia aomiensis]